MDKTVIRETKAAASGKTLELTLSYSDRQWVAAVTDVTDSRCHICIWAAASLDRKIAERLARQEFKRSIRSYK